MLKTRDKAEQEELLLLAPYAQKSSDSQGRKYREAPHAFRTLYQQDRSRIIHSKAFRLLESKTQVFLNGSGDELRTRLTHSTEVSLISRTIAKALSLNEDLAETIALAHDLGHPPFGHSGEQTLNALMHGYGGFEHSEQSRRVVEILEQRFPRFSGLNLSIEVLEGLGKHPLLHESMESTDSSASAHPAKTFPTLEAQVVCISDEITCFSHDIADGLEAKLISDDQLDKLPIWLETKNMVRKLFPKLCGNELTTTLIYALVERQVEDTIQASHDAILKSGVTSVAEVRQQKHPLIRYSRAFNGANKLLRKFLHDHIYNHPRVEAVNHHAGSMLKNVFGTYIQCPKLLGSESSRLIKQYGLHRTVCDYLSGMTDRSLLKEHQRLFLDEGMQRAMRINTPPPRWRGCE